jgi:IS30 family transposase
MALETKKGGPYTKKDQEKRKDEVFKLHFEYGYSAVQIAKLLNVNRNTINEDIKYWYSELYNEDKSNFSREWLDKQFMRLELQRARLRKELDEDISLKERLQVEKCITNIDLSISSLIVKIETARKIVRLG